MRLNFTLATLIFLCLCVTRTSAQLSAGSEAPDFTLTDINGETHNLYDLLDAGKTVVIDFSATWCGPCWNYHNTHAMKDFYIDHGPDGTEESMVFFIEADLNTGLDDLNGETSGTQGDWVEGTPYPIIDLQTSEVSDAYNINYYPTIYKVCSDKKVYEVGQVPASTLGNWIQSCTFEASLAGTTDTECFGEGQGGATLNVSGGYGTPNFNWSNGANTEELSGVEAGTYSVAVSDDNGRTEFISGIDILGPEDPIEIFYSSIIDVGCLGDASGSIVIEAEGGNGVESYAWSTGDVSPEISDVPAGVYEVTVTDANGCEITGAFEVMEPTQLESSSNSQTAHCGGADGMIDFQVFGGTGPYTVDSEYGEVNMTDGTITGLPAGTYEVFVSDANGCETSFEQTIGDTDNPEVFVSNPEMLSCVSASTTLTATVNYDVPENLSYTWIGPDGIIAGANEATITVDQPGEYTVIVEDIEYGCEAEDFAIVQGDVDVPEIAVPADMALDCDHLQLDIAVSIEGGADGLNISWTTADGNIVSGADAQTIGVDAPGTYVVVVSNPENGCFSEQSITVTDDRSYPESNFGFETEELTANFANMSNGNNLTFEWDFGDGATSNEQSPTHTYAFSGVYPVCLTARNNCGSEMVCFDVLVEAAASAIQIGYVVSHVACAGDANATIQLTIAGGVAPFTYEWTGPNGFSSTEQNIADLTAGAYIVLVEDSDGNQAQVQIFVNEPEALATDVAVASDLWGSSIDLEVTGGTAPYNYQWSNGATTEDLSNVTSGEYTCEITDANGCVIAIESITVGNPIEVPDPPAWDRDVSRVTLEGNPGIQPINIHVHGASLNSEHNFQLVNVAGMLVSSGKWYGNYHSADFTNQINGIYMLAIYNNDGWVATEKIFIGK